uniref:DUF4939 domain-containing protein n=1 Tax=Oryzias latipes TaxID=8090 RepID=A0A3P9L6M7_ORYLA
MISPKPLFLILIKLTTKSLSPSLLPGFKRTGIALGHQAESLHRMASAQQDLFCRLDGISLALMELTGQQSATYGASASPPAADNPAFATASGANENIRLQPETFRGDVEACGGFILQCQLIFQQALRHYHADHSKITLIVNSVRGKAFQWAQAYLTANPIFQVPFERFIRELRLVFDQPPLRQHNRSVSEHLIDFRILAVEAGCAHPGSSGTSPEHQSDRGSDLLHQTRPKV